MANIPQRVRKGPPTREDARTGTVGPGGGNETVWIHPATFTYRWDEPERLLETIWTAHPGWGYLKRRDLWVQVTRPLDELIALGFREKRPLDGRSVMECPHCRMSIDSIPPSLVKKHVDQCGGLGEDWGALEAMAIEEKRMKDFERELREAALREEEERRTEERRERFDKIKEEAQARQVQRDRKKRMKEETRRGFKDR